MPTPPAETGIPKFEPTPSSEFKPAESTVAQSPAVTALVTAATQSTKTGDVESASAAIERAIRIEPRNAELLYKLAVLRLKQSKPVLAEDLAKKAALLAGKDNTLKKNSWLLIAHAKEMQGDKTGAEEAKTKAAGF
jgi:Tfp pilus assembly protein PilF